MIVGGVLRIGSSVGVIVGRGVMVDVGGIGVCVTVDGNVRVNVSAGGATCVCAVLHAERVRPIAKIRERSFFIVHLIEWNYTL